MRNACVTYLVATTVCCAIAFMGCDDNGNGGGSGSVPSRSDLVGTWTSTEGGETESYELRNDGTFVMTSDDGEDQWTDEGTWSFGSGIITLIFEGSESEEGYTITWREEFSTRVAIVDGMLYIGVAHRTSGSGSGLAGTWQYDETEEEEESETGPEGSYSGSGGYEYEERTTVTGSAFTSNWSEREFEEEDGETYDETESGTQAGTARTDGDRVYFTVTEADGEPVADPDREEVMYGYRIAPDVIVISWGEEDGGRPGGLQRQ